MSAASPNLAAARPISIDAGAHAHLRFIRETMEAAGTFTSVPGVGCIAMGLVALAAAAAEAVLGVPRPAAWLAAAPVAAALALFFFARKTRRQGLGLSRAVVRRFFTAFTPALVAGAVLTVVLLDTGNAELLPGTWLLLYGAALAACGAFSLPGITGAGVSFMILGTLAFAWPAAASALLAAGFGGVHVALGLIVLRRHGG